MGEEQQTTDPVQSDQPDYYEGLTPEEAVIGAKILPKLADTANRLARENKSKELAVELTILKEENQKRMQTLLEDTRKANTPLEPAELGKLLSQEYVEFSFAVG